jgi:hypothetical protein
MKNFGQYEETFNSKLCFQRCNVKTLKVNNKISQHLRNEQKKICFPGKNCSRKIHFLFKSITTEIDITNFNTVKRFATSKFAEDFFFGQGGCACFF